VTDSTPICSIQSSRLRISAWPNAARAAGIGFNYLLNASCTDNLDLVGSAPTAGSILGQLPEDLGNGDAANLFDQGIIEVGRKTETHLCSPFVTRTPGARRGPTA
jgi:hypothetical protein